MSERLPSLNYLNIVPVEIFCQFWKELGCVPASYLAPAVKQPKAKQNIYNCATCVIVDTMDFDSSILLKLKNLNSVVIKTSWKKNTPLTSVLSKLAKNGVEIKMSKITPKTLVECELYGLISYIVPTYTYKEIEQLVYLLLASPKPGVQKCIKCIIKYKPQLKTKVQEMIEYAITTEYSKSTKPNMTKIQLLKKLR
jgi:Zn-finger protein